MGSGIIAPRSGFTRHEIGISSFFCGIRDRAVPFLWDQGSEIGVQNEKMKKKKKTTHLVTTLEQAS